MPTLAPAYVTKQATDDEHAPSGNTKQETWREYISPQARPSDIGVVLRRIYIYIYISENTLGECRINILIKKGERERRLERGKNDHRNPAGNRENIFSENIFATDSDLL